MVDDERHERAIGLAQTIAMQAMELPAGQRLRFIKRAVTAVRREFERKYVADPETAAAADELQALIESMVQIIEENGGTIGNA